MNRLLYWITRGVFLTAIIGSTSSCSKDLPADDFPGKIVLEPREFFSGKDRHIALYAVTTEEYPCSNFLIGYNRSTTNGGTVIEFKGVQLADDCITIMGPAKAFIDLGLITEASGKMVFEISQEMVRSVFQTTAEYLKIIITEGGSTRLAFSETMMHRLPENYVWGYAHAKTAVGDDAYTVFLNKLHQSGAEKISLEPGNYGFIRVTEDKNMIIFDRKGQIESEHSFVFAYDDDFQILQSIAENFRDEFVIILYSAKGDHFHNQKF